MAKPIGIQLYSLREYSEVDFLSVLKGVAEIGYTYVEPAGMGKGSAGLGSGFPLILQVIQQIF